MVIYATSRNTVSDALETAIRHYNTFSPLQDYAITYAARGISQVLASYICNVSTVARI